MKFLTDLITWMIILALCEATALFIIMFITNKWDFDIFNNGIFWRGSIIGIIFVSLFIITAKSEVKNLFKNKDG